MRENQFSFYPAPLGNGLFIDMALPDGSDDPVVLAYMRGEPINQYLIYWLNLFCKPGGNLLDLGCHVGTMSVIAAGLNYNVLAVDASKLHTDLIRASATHNILPSLKVIRCAISDKDGKISFNENGLWGMVPPKNHDDFAEIVSMRRVDTLLTEEGWDHLDLLKMDIEGSELAALKGMTEILVRKDAPAIIYESNGMTFEMFGYTIGDIREYLENFGYLTYRVEGDRLVYCPPSELQPEAWLDLVALPAHKRELLSDRIDSEWNAEAFVLRCLEWGRNEHKSVREYVSRVMSSDLDYPRRDKRIINLFHDLAQEFNPNRR